MRTMLNLSVSAAELVKFRMPYQKLFVKRKIKGTLPMQKIGENFFAHFCAFVELVRFLVKIAGKGRDLFDFGGFTGKIYRWKLKFPDVE